MKKPTLILKINGFTLLEFLVVLVLISLISALVVPQLTKTLPTINLKTAAKKSSALLRYARNKAVTESWEYLVRIDIDKHLISLISKETDNEKELYERSEMQETGTEFGRKEYKYPNGIRIDKIEMGDDTIESGIAEISFFMEGNSTGGEIYLADENGNNVIITIDFITGITRISE